MKAEEANESLLSFSVRVTDDSVVRCPACNKASRLAFWSLGEWWCDTCWDNHCVAICPGCDEGVDWTWQDDPMEVVA